MVLVHWAWIDWPPVLVAFNSSEAMSSVEIDVLPERLNILCPAATAGVIGLVVGYMMKLGVVSMTLVVPGGEEGSRPR